MKRKKRAEAERTVSAAGRISAVGQVVVSVPIQIVGVWDGGASIRAGNGQTVCLRSDDTLMVDVTVDAKSIVWGGA